MNRWAKNCGSARKRKQKIGLGFSILRGEGILTHKDRMIPNNGTFRNRASDFLISAVAWRRDLPRHTPARSDGHHVWGISLVVPAVATATQWAAPLHGHSQLVQRNESQSLNRIMGPSLVRSHTPEIALSGRLYRMERGMSSEIKKAWAETIGRENGRKSTKSKTGLYQQKAWLIIRSSGRPMESVSSLSSAGFSLFRQALCSSG